MNHFDHVRKTFELDHLPANVRASRFLGRWPFIRRYQKIPIGLGLLPAEGRFFYQQFGERRLVKFNGRNLQFHALYESHYRFGYELETALLITALCRGNTPFFDIGSNWGYFSLLAAALPEFSGPIFAFEPNPRTFADLKSTIAQAGVSDRVRACNLGIGRNACEMVVAELDAYNTGLSRLANVGGGQRIPVKPLDSLEFGAPGVIKIDAEGMELDILSGAAQMLKNARPFVVFENFLDAKSPQNTYSAINLLRASSYKVFIPTLKFSIAGCPVVSTYGQDYTAFIEQEANPKLGVVELSGERRFLLNGQLNLLGVHVDRAHELWKLGVSDFGGM